MHFFYFFLQDLHNMTFCFDIFEDFVSPNKAGLKFLHPHPHDLLRLQPQLAPLLSAKADTGAAASKEKQWAAELNILQAIKLFILHLNHLISV